MLRILLSISAMLAACTSSPEKAAMGSAPKPTAMTMTSPSDPLGDSPAEARGRLILSTAFVQAGPDRHLTVELRDGRVLALRDVVMRARDYCGVQATGDPARYCGGYSEVAGARPGGAQSSPNAVEPAPGPPAAK